MRRLNYRKKYGIKEGLRGYQRRAAQVGVLNPRYALLMAPRLGKTRVDIAVTGYRRIYDGIKRWVIVCPSIAKQVWADEIEKVFNLPYHLEIIEGKADERRLIFKEWEDQPGKLSILIINHEATWRLKKFLYKFNPDKVTVDESHKIKSRSAKQTTSITTLGTRAEFRSILTGTLMATPPDAFSQFRFLEPRLFGTRWKDFENRYVDTFGFGGHKPKTFKNLDEFNEKIQSVSFQLDREQAGGFPKEQVQEFRFDLEKPAARHYQEMLEKLTTMVRGQNVTAPIVLTQILRLQQITGGFLPTLNPDLTKTNNPIRSGRLKFLRGLVEEYGRETPLVIFCRFRYEVSAVLDLMQKLGRSSGFIRGGMSRGDRNHTMESFQGGNLSTCVVQIRAGSVAIDLSRARTGIFYSMTHSHFDLEQARSRIMARTGGSVSLLHILARGTVDEDILRAARQGGDLVREVLRAL